MSARLEGFKEASAVLSSLSKATARNTLKRALGPAARILRDKVEILAPEREGTLQGIYIAPQGQDGSNGAWERQFTGPVNIEWFGGRGDDVTDNSQPRDAALAVMNARADSFNGTGKLFYPAAPLPYWHSTTSNIRQSVEIQGEGQDATILRFSNIGNGIVFNERRTNNDAGSASDLGVGDAGNSSLRDLTIWGAAAQSVNGPWVNPAATSGHGIRIRTANVSIENVTVKLFGGAGVYIEATSGSMANGGYGQGNANQFNLIRVTCMYNGGEGFAVYGADANAGQMLLCNASDNGGAGFREYSFLGNTYIQPHTRDNGVRDPIGSNRPTGTAKYGGNHWYVVAGKEAQASTEAPGSVTGDGAAWRSFPGHIYSKDWVSGLTWVAASPYMTSPINSNGRNVFIGCYAETGQPPVQAFYPTIFTGGLLEEVGFAPQSSAPWLKGAGDGLMSNRPFFHYDENTTRHTLFGGRGAFGDFIFDHTGGGHRWALAELGNGLAFQKSGYGTPMFINDDVTSILGSLAVNGAKVVGPRASPIADAAAGSEVATINSILAMLRSHGLIAN